MFSLAKLGAKFGTVLSVFLVPIMHSSGAVAESYNYTCQLGKKCQWVEGVAPQHEYRWYISCVGGGQKVAPSSISCYKDKSASTEHCSAGPYNAESSYCDCNNQDPWTNNVTIKVDCSVSTGHKKK